MDVLPQSDDAKGSYQLVTPQVEPSIASLRNPDGTLASKATLRASGCGEAALTIVDGTGQFATITASRVGNIDTLHASDFAPVALEITQGGISFRATLNFRVARGTLVPLPFSVPTGNTANAQIRFRDEAEAHVKVTGSGAIVDERTLVHAVSLASFVGNLLATNAENDIERYKQRRCG
ncbi:MAG: hypothetical protein ACKVPX_04305 [Myxococcaceae bacterium]